jgi:hypothetical protein
LLDCASGTITLTGLLQDYLVRPSPDGRIWAARIIEKLLEEAAGGDLKTMQEIWLRTEGKPGTGASSARVPVSDEVARKIFAALNEDDDDPPDD